jgi:hypothetical protein
MPVSLRWYLSFTYTPDPALISILTSGLPESVTAYLHQILKFF